MTAPVNRTPLHDDVPVVIPRRIWGRLASEADERGIPIADLIVLGITAILGPDDVDHQIVKLAKAGFSDKAIADRTGELLNRVAFVRRRAGLKANRDRRDEYLRGLR